MIPRDVEAVKVVIQGEGEIAEKPPQRPAVPDGREITDVPEGEVVADVMKIVEVKGAVEAVAIYDYSEKRDNDRRKAPTDPFIRVFEGGGLMGRLFVF
ncbi:hypothetical protein ACFL55_01075 [Candidatus Latescibacterota bacterium]